MRMCAYPHDNKGSFFEKVNRDWEEESFRMSSVFSARNIATQENQDRQVKSVYRQSGRSAPGEKVK